MTGRVGVTGLRGVMGRAGCAAPVGVIGLCRIGLKEVVLEGRLRDRLRLKDRNLSIFSQKSNSGYYF